MNVDILISTYGSGINFVPYILLEERDDVKYIVSHQYGIESNLLIPNSLTRKDIIVSQISGKGLTKSRNNAINLSQSFIGIFSDDDVKYTNLYIDTIIRYHKKYKDFDIILFKIKTPSGEPEYKTYENKIKEYKKVPNVSSIEMTFKTNSIKQAGVKFDERFGAGNKFLIGSEERIFLHDCLKAGLKILYVPEYIVEHPFESTVKTISEYDNRRIRVTGGLDARINGPIAIPKSFIGTIKFLPDLIKHKKNPIIYFWERFRAAVYITFTKTTK